MILMVAVQRSVEKKKLERKLRKFARSFGFSRSDPRERGTPNFFTARKLGTTTAAKKSRCFFVHSGE
jgi:hypothetical protein